MGSLFSYCKISSLSSFSNWNTRNVINMNSMFKQFHEKESHMYGYSPDSIIFSLGNYIYNKVTDTNCLSNLSGLEKWDTSNVEDMRDMFYNCSKIKIFSPLSNWNIEKANIENIFKYCNDKMKIPDNFQNKINQLKNKNN